MELKFGLWPEHKFINKPIDSNGFEFQDFQERCISPFANLFHNI